jgi:hypothetical protein
MRQLFQPWLESRGYEQDDYWHLPSVLSEVRSLKSLEDEWRAWRSLAELGPFALGVARRLNDFNRRHPRLKDLAKRAMHRFTMLRQAATGGRSGVMSKTGTA